MFTQTAFFLF